MFSSNIDNLAGITPMIHLARPNCDEQMEAKFVSTLPSKKRHVKGVHFTIPLIVYLYKTEATGNQQHIGATPAVLELGILSKKAHYLRKNIHILGFIPKKYSMTSKPKGHEVIR
jgi:hypothetical protein